MEYLFMELCTMILFGGACSLLSIFAMSYTVLELFKSRWLEFLEKRYPELVFERGGGLQSALDTPRNSGVVTLLCCVNGQPDINTIRSKINEDLVYKKSESGSYAHPRLRMILTSRWGHYAWAPQPRGYDVTNHVTLLPSVYRGRPITRHNVQEFVNEVLCSRFVVDEMGPWHISVIPTCEGKYYILIRIHHLLLTGHSHITLAHLLPLVDTTMTSQMSSEPFDTSRWSRSSAPLSALYKPPRALMQLLDKFSLTFTNSWNEILTAYDPIHNPKIICNPDLRAILALLSIWLYSSVLGQQTDVTFSVLLTALWRTLTLAGMIKWTLGGCKILLIKLPLVCLCEIWALFMIHDEYYSDRSVVKSAFNGWLTAQSAVRDVFYLWKLLYTGPKIILEEIWTSPPYFLYTNPNRSRKVVGWSQPVAAATIEAIAEATGSSRTDILLAATAAALKDLCLLQDNHVPPYMLTTASSLSLPELFSKATDRGFVCLPIPLRSQWEPECADEQPITELRAIQQVVLSTRLKQSALYLASKLNNNSGFFHKSLPNCIVRMVMNQLTRRVSVSITEVTPAPTNSASSILWGQSVTALMYWPPLQANMCLSLTLLSHGGAVTLGVMADSALAPHHTILLSTWFRHLRSLAVAAGVGGTSPTGLPRPLLNTWYRHVHSLTDSEVRTRPLEVTPRSDVDSDGSATPSSPSSDISSDLFSYDEDSSTHFS